MTAWSVPRKAALGAFIRTYEGHRLSEALAARQHDPNSCVSITETPEHR